MQYLKNCQKMTTIPKLGLVPSSTMHYAKIRKDIYFIVLILNIIYDIILKIKNYLIIILIYINYYRHISSAASGPRN